LHNQKEFNVRYILKHHPVHNSDKFYKKIPESYNGIFLKEECMGFDALLRQSSLVFSYSSSVCIEALSLGVPVAVFGNRRGITNNIIPKDFNPDMWKVVYSYKQLYDFIKSPKKKNNDNIFHKSQFSSESARGIFL